MFGDGALTLREFVMHEALPLATIHNAVLEFLRDRDDAVVFGAQAVNAYVSEPRMTQDIDLMSFRAAELAQELRDDLSERFHIAVRVRQVGEGRGYRVFQVRKSGNRHLVDVRSVETLPLAQRIAQVLVAEPVELIASKVIAYHQRRGNPKSGTDWRDLVMLLLTFPEFKRHPDLVADRLKAADADPSVLSTWKELAAQEIRPADEDDEF
ncbi:MAG: nucleotidyl transferase AbiEii/AbiGii toxin family protein [Candidatus Latescibacteria bacterium]|nr:nucleotidyl transferase AbiEii/AbiGii toxin family protein [Candidatus Latescibacterota bacterium]